MTQQNRTKVLASIEWFTPAFQAGGIISSLVNQIDHLSDRFEFHVVCSNRDLIDPDPMTLEAGRWQDRDGHRVLHIEPPFEWTDILDAVKPDIISVNGLFNGPFCRNLIALAAKINVPMVVAAHGMLAPNALAIKPLRKKAWLTAQRIRGSFCDMRWQASNPTEAAQIEHWFPGSTIHIAQNLPPVMPGSVRETAEDVSFLSVGRLHPIKNYSFGARVLQQLAAKSGLHITYRIAGPLEDKAEEHAIKQWNSSLFKTEFLGVIRPSELPQLYQESRALLVPSLSENFGQVVAEAMANGLPAITSTHTPWGQYGDSDFLFNLDLETDIWVNALEPLLDPIKRNSLTKDCRRFYSEQLAKEDILDQHATLLTP